MEGNQQKMRETLLVVRDALDSISAHEDDIEFVRAWIKQTKEAVQEALAEPPRNCDVGTAVEQTERRQRYCKWRQTPLSENRTCRGCPVYDAMMVYANEAKDADCDLIWAQMPYEAKGGGAK